jgi:hypothetical protein
VALTFEALRQEADNRNLVRKIQKAALFLRLKGNGENPGLPTTLFDATSNTQLVDLKADLWLPAGMVTPDGYTFTREVNKEDVAAMGYASSVRSDVTTVPRTISFTGLENLKRHMLELQYGTDLSAIEQTVNGEIVFDEPDLPLDSEYELLVIGADGPPSAQWVLGRGYGTVKLSGTGDEVWGQEGAQSKQYTLDVFTDEETGSPVRHYIGGTGAKGAASDLGFAQAAAA